MGDLNREELKRLRKARGWTQRQLAARVGVDISTVGCHEAGLTVHASQDVLSRYAHAFGVTVDQLIIGPPAPRYETNPARLPEMEDYLRLKYGSDLASLWRTLTQATCNRREGVA